MKKTILITGASGDIGSEICRFFIKNNYKVIGKTKLLLKRLQKSLEVIFLIISATYLILIMLKSYLRI